MTHFLSAMCNCVRVCVCVRRVCGLVFVFILVPLFAVAVLLNLLSLLSTCLCVWVRASLRVCVCARHYADILKCPTRAVLTVCISINLSLASKVHSFSLSRCICTFIYNSKYNNNSDNKGSAFHFRLCHLFARLQAQGVGERGQRCLNWHTKHPVWLIN